MKSPHHAAAGLVASSLAMAITIGPLALPAPAVAATAAQPAPPAQPAASGGGPAASSTVTISGVLTAQMTGLPVPNARVTLARGTTTLATTTTDGAGRYAFASVPAGVYAVQIRADGYQATNVVDVVAASSTTVRTSLLQADTVAPAKGLRTIGQSQTSATGSTLASSTTIQYNLDPQQLESQGYVKSADAIGQLPGVNISGGPHSVGDDTSIDIRGMGPGEVRPLLDGHPVGPLGVDSPDYYDYANSPYFLLSNIQVTVGSGASGLYGTDVIGGTIDFQTLDPSAAPHGEVVQRWGDQNLLQTQIKATGAVGKFGFAVGHTVIGTTGDFQPALIFQSARPNNNLNLNNGGACTAGNDLTSCNTQLNTYSVSGNYRVQNDLAKLQYRFSSATSLTLTAYAANQLSDSTGNGDDDAIPYDTRLAEIKAQQTPNCNNGTGYTVITDTNPNACYSAAQYAAASYGPYGGGADRNRGTTLQDFHGRFQTTLSGNLLTADFYRDFYDFRKNSNEAAGFDPTGTYYVGTGTYEDEYLTDGFLFSDDIASSRNDFGFGYSVTHQREYGNNFDPGTFAAPGVAFVAPSYVPQSELGTGLFSYFLRDEYFANDKLSFYLNAWQHYSNVTEKATFDPRLSIVIKPTHRDVVRLTGGRADGDPSVALKQGELNSFGNPSSLNPSCNLLNSVANGPNPDVQPESATDYELAYGHGFWSDTSINVVGYVSEVKNELFNTVVPLSSYPGGATNPQVDLAGYATKIGQSCGLDLTPATVLPYLGVSETANAASGIFRGIELTGRIRATRQFYADYDYGIQSSRDTGFSNNILVSNPFLIDNGQLLGIPVHKGSVTLDYNNRYGFETQLQGFYIGDNNTLNRPAYTFFNGFVSKRLQHNFVATASVTNLFAQNVQTYGYFGHQLYVPQNSFAAPSSNSIEQAVQIGNTTPTELLGLSPRVFSFSVSAQL